MVSTQNTDQRVALIAVVRSGLINMQNQKAGSRQTPVKSVVLTILDQKIFTIAGLAERPVNATGIFQNPVPGGRSCGSRQ